MVIGYTDLIVIAQLLGPDQVPAYAVAFSFLTMYVAMELAILDAVWPGYSDAASRGDLTWLVRTHRRVTLLFTVGALVLASLMVLIGQPFIRVWAGPNVVPSMALLVTLGALGVVQAYQLPHGRMLTALGHVRTNSILAVVNAAINLPVSLVLVTWIGLPGAAAGSLLGYLVVGPFVLVKARAAMGAVGGGAITGPSGPGHR
jgi:O-antigen/teichoic acid export membrane protein